MIVHLPKIHYEWILFLLFWFGGIWLIYFELYIVSPNYHKAWNNTMTVHVIIALFLAVNIYMNMAKLITTSVGCKELITEPPLDSPPLGWKYCEKCEIHTPPRSHHCKICKECVLKRDHHCFFAGYCIGYFNHRYFFTMTVYMTIAAFYCNIYNWQYYMDYKGGFSWTTIPGIIAPHMGLMLGYYSIWEFIFTAHMFTGIMLNLLFAVLLSQQISYCLSGQLSYERRKGIEDYSISPASTFRDVFGSAGLWVFICPFIASKFPGDGTSFVTKKDSGKKRD